MYRHAGNGDEKVLLVACCDCTGADEESGGEIAMKWWTILYMTISLAVFRLDRRDSKDR